MKTTKKTVKRKPRATCDVITQKNTEHFWLSAESTSLDGKPDFAKEQAMETLATKYGGCSTGAGTDLVTGRRDHSFIFPTRTAVAAFMRDAVKARFLRPEISCSHMVLDWCERTYYRDVHYRKILKKSARV